MAGASPEVPAEIAAHDWSPAIAEVNLVVPSAAVRIEGVYPTFFFVREEGALQQLVLLHLRNNAAESIRVSLTAQGQGRGAQSQEYLLQPGWNELLFQLNDRRQTATVEMQLSIGDVPQQRLAFNWEPDRQWKAYVVQTSHFDYGYTGLREAIMEKRDVIFNTVLDYITQTDDWPEDARFRWIIEASYCLEHFLETNPWREEEIQQRIDEGRIEISAKLLHTHSSTIGHEELIRNLHLSTIALADRFDADILTACHNDVDGITWGSVAAWAGAGVRYFSFNPNYFYRGGNVLHDTDAPQAYYWVGADDSRVLTWRSRWAYGDAAYLLEGLASTLIQFPHLLEGYENSGYPYDAIHLTRTGEDRYGAIKFSDNSMPHLEVCDTVRQWNEIYEYPKLICATSAQFFQYLEENYADEILELSGDCPDWWADGVNTGSVAEAKVRRLHHQLIETETLASVAAMLESSYAYPQADLAQAWQDALFFDEHTWGYIFPFLHFHGAIWDEKVNIMEDGVAICEDLVEPARYHITKNIAGEGWSLTVFNALSWERDDIVHWPLPAGFPQAWLGSEFFAIQDREGAEVPYQIVAVANGGAEVVFLARGVPSLGYATYQLVTAEEGPAFPDGLSLGASTMENEFYRITFDLGLGVVSLYDKLLDRELIDQSAPYRLNEYIARRQGYFDLHDDRKTGLVWGCSVQETGPVFLSLVCQGADPNNPASIITQEVRLYDGLKRIDFTNHVADFFNSLGQSKYFAFPFDVPNFEFRVDIPLAVMEPYYEQLPDFAKYYAVQHWVDVSSAVKGFGVTWATAEGPMVELGEITKVSGFAQAVFAPDYYDPGEYPYAPTYPTIYSEIMNNFQNTNFSYNQMGSGVWRYAVTSHEGSWDQPPVTRFGWDLSSPLMAELVPANPEGILPDVLSFFTVQEANVKILAVKMAEDGDGFIVRLFENEGRATTATLEIPFLKNLTASLVDLAERKIESLTPEENRVIVNIEGFGLSSIRLSGELAYPLDDDVDDDIDDDQDDDDDDGGQPDDSPDEEQGEDAEGCGW
ncbi:MAG: glycosyl hydrolase-related protein [Alphaproteobacteria bacterium]